MSRIHLLEDHIINKIAAGEVVERPASVVKELLENSLDSGASHIDVELEEGGKKRITIRDNGCGISEDDVLLSLTRHATSKISSADDLFQVESLGFRGEALASISSVSRLTLCSREKERDVGVKVLADHNGLSTPITWQGPVGTSITISDLFYNVPAREKFLKSSTSEYAHSMELVQSIALARPEVSISLTHNGKEKFRVSGVSTKKEADQSFFGEAILRERTEGIWGEELVSKLIYATEESPYGRFEGLISPPGIEKASTKFIMSFVNGRWVKDKTLRFGVLRGYQSHLLKGRFPQAVIFFHCDPALVDVNVHPAKTELRFQYSAEVQSLLSIGIRKALRSGAWAEPEPEDKSVEKSPLQEEQSPTTDLGSMYMPKESKPTAQSLSSLGSSYSSNFRDIPRKSIQSSPGLLHDMKSEPQAEEDFNFPSASGLQSGYESINSTPELIIPKITNEVIPWKDLKYIGSFQKCYLLFEWEKKLLAVDQHAFHERIQFEKLLKDRALLLSSQPLIIPEIIEQEPKLLDFLIESKEMLLECGFNYRIINEKLIEITAVPSILMGRNLEEIFTDMIKEDKRGSDAMEHVSISGDRWLSTLACHSAIRAGEELVYEDILELIEEARSVDFYHNCPHGRRVFKWQSKREVESWFDR